MSRPAFPLTTDEEDSSWQTVRDLHTLTHDLLTALEAINRLETFSVEERDFGYTEVIDKSEVDAILHELLGAEY